MPEIDAVRVRVLLENLCDLEPAWFWPRANSAGIVVKSDFSFSGAAWAVQILPNGDAKIHLPTIRDALEALHDSKDWFVHIESDSNTNELGEEIRSHACRIYDPFIGWAAPIGGRKLYGEHTAFTRLEAMLEATNKALGGAS